MIIMNMNDAKETKIETFPYKGKPYDVKDVWIRWLSQAGPKDSPEYGLRFFTIGPSGKIPIHNHLSLIDALRRIISPASARLHSPQSTICPSIVAVASTHHDQS